MLSFFDEHKSVTESSPSQSCRMNKINAGTGGASVLKQALARLIAEKAKEAARKLYSYCPDFESLDEPLHQWGHYQYSCVATLLAISMSTAKRLFNGDGYINPERNINPPIRQKIEAFLGTDSWEKEALYYLLKNGLETR